MQKKMIESVVCKDHTETKAYFFLLESDRTLLLSRQKLIFFVKKISNKLINEVNDHF